MPTLRRRSANRSSGKATTRITTEEKHIKKHKRQNHARIRRIWGRGRTPPPPQLENRKTIGSLAIHARIPCKIARLQSLHSMLGHYRRASETPF